MPVEVNWPFEPRTILSVTLAREVRLVHQRGGLLIVFGAWLGLVGHGTRLLALPSGIGRREWRKSYQLDAVGAIIPFTYFLR
jgi:hypothetical protein